MAVAMCYSGCFYEDRTNKMLGVTLLLGLLLSWQVGTVSCSHPDIVIGVIEESSVLYRKLLSAAVEFVQRDLLEGANIWVNHTNITAAKDGGSLLQLSLTVCDLLKEGIHGLIGHVDCPSAHVLADFLSARAVPVILVAPPDCSMPVLPPGVFRMRTRPENFRFALLDFLSSQWVTAQVIFYDSFTETSFVETLLWNQTKLWGTAMFVQEQLSPDQQELLADMSQSSPYTVFTVFLQPATAANLLKLAVQLNLHTPFQTWVVMFEDPVSCMSFSPGDWTDGNLFLVSSDYHPIEQLPCPPMLFHLQEYVPANMTLGDAYVLDAFLIMANAIIKDRKNDTTAPFSVNSCSSNEEPEWSEGLGLIKQIRQTEFHGTSGHTHFRPDGYNYMVVVDFWAVDAAATRGRSLRAQWTPERHLERRYEPLLVNPPDNFHNRSLKVGVVQSAPYVFVTYDEKEKTSKFSGFCIEIVEVLKSVLNFSVEYVDGGEEYGNREGNHWTGMMGKVIRGEVDFAAAAFSVTKEREEAIDFTIPFNQDSSAFLLKRPGDGRRIARVFLPFHITVWVSIFTSVALVGLLLFAVRLWLADHSAKPEVAATEATPAVGMLRMGMDNLWFAYGTYVEQSMEHYPQCQSGRVLVAFWWLFTIIMSATYTANLVASLTVSLQDKPISTLEELANDPNILPLILPGNSLRDAFIAPDATDVYKELWTQLNMVPRPLPNTTEEALSMVATGKYSLINDQGIIGYSAVQHCDKFVLADETFNPSGQAFIMRQGADFKYLFDLNLAKMHESGIIQKWHSRWWVPTPGACSTDRTSNWRNLNIESLAGAFIVLAVAIFISLLTLGTELLLSSSRRAQAWTPTDRAMQNGRDTE